jgi:hypothetical protein
VNTVGPPCLRVLHWRHYGLGMKSAPRCSCIEGLSLNTIPRVRDLGKWLNHEGFDLINGLNCRWIHKLMCYWEVVKTGRLGLVRSRSLRAFLSPALHPRLSLSAFFCNALVPWCSALPLQAPSNGTSWAWTKTFEIMNQITLSSFKLFL